MRFPLAIGIGVGNERLENMMKNRHSFKKAVMILSTAAVFTGTGIFGTAITAWAAFPSDGTIAAEGINVRTSAVDGSAIDTLSAGKEVTVLDSTTGSDGSEWYQIEYTSSGQTFSGWVRSDLVDVEDADAETEDAEAEAEKAAEEAEQAAEEEQAAEQDAAEAEEAEKEETQSTETGSQAITLAVSDSIPVDIIPDGFHQTTVSYEGKEVPALEMEDAEVYLLYMEDTSHQTDGRLVVYDLAKSELIPYICFPTDDGYILLLNIPDAELSAVSDRFAKTVCEFDTGTMDALQMTQKDSVISESANLTDFYYMYGVNQDGSYGWYTYNEPEGTIEESILSMHYNLNGTSVDVEEKTSSFSLDSLSMIVIVGIIVIFILLLILVIIFGVRYRQLVNAMDGKGSRRKKRNKEQGPPESDSSEAADYGNLYGGDSPDASAESPYTEQEMPPFEEQAPQPGEEPMPQPGEEPTPQPSEEPAPRPGETPTPQPEETPTKRSDAPVRGTPDPDDDDLEFL